MQNGLLANIEKRHSTILAVASQIVERQQAFFEEGPSAMKPMILRDVSEALDIHESTVSGQRMENSCLRPSACLSCDTSFRRR